MLAEAVAPKEVKARQSPNRTFRALDADLPILAARAALQLDQLIRKGAESETNLDAVEKLAVLFCKVGSATNGLAQVRSLIDPLSANVLSRAYSETRGHQLKSWEELIAVSIELAEQLELGKGNKSDELVRLRDFCVHLSDFSASQRQLAFEGRPKPPYLR